jgi:hypothetical protein
MPSHHDFRGVGCPPVPHAGALARRQHRLVPRTLHDPPRTRRATLRHARRRDLGGDGPHASMAVTSVAITHDAAGLARCPNGTRQGELAQRLRMLPATAQSLVVVDAAGPCRYGRSRDLPQTNRRGGGVAPAWMPHTAGARVTPARRDARPRARLMRAGAVPPGEVPPGQRQRSAPARARADTSRARHAAHWRRNACWLRPDLRDMGRATGRPAYRRGLSAGGGPPPAPHRVFHAYGRASPRTSHLCHVGRQHATHRSTPGGGLPSSPPSRPSEGCHARSRSPGWLTAVT